MPADPVVVELRELHQKRKRADLGPEEKARYDALRDSFARAYVRANHISMLPGQTCRQVVRAEHAVQVELADAARRHRTITLDLSPLGFAALLGLSLEVGTPCDFVLNLRPEPARGTGRVVACGRYGSGNSSFRVSVAFAQIAPRDAQRIETAVFDAALSALR